MAKVTLSDVKAAQPEWFSRKNKKFFGDISYRVMKGKKSHQPFLVRQTCGWTDMFDRPKRCHLVVNDIKEDLKIGSLVKTGSMPFRQFDDLDDVKDWLAEH